MPALDAFSVSSAGHVQAHLRHPVVVVEEEEEENCKTPIFPEAVSSLA